MDREQLKKIGEEFAARFMRNDEKGRVLVGKIMGGDGEVVYLSGRTDTFSVWHRAAKVQYPGYQPGEDALLVGYTPVALLEGTDAPDPDRPSLRFPRVFQNVNVYYGPRGVVRAGGG